MMPGLLNGWQLRSSGCHAVLCTLLIVQCTLTVLWLTQSRYGHSHVPSNHVEPGGALDFSLPAEAGTRKDHVSWQPAEQSSWDAFPRKGRRLRAQDQRGGVLVAVLSDHFFGAQYEGPAACTLDGAPLECIFQSVEHGSDVFKQADALLYHLPTAGMGTLPEKARPEQLRVAMTLESASGCASVGGGRVRAGRMLACMSMRCSLPDA